MTARIRQMITAVSLGLLLLVPMLSLLLPVRLAYAAPDPTDVPDFVATWGSEGSGNGQFVWPSVGAIDADSYMYIADSGNSRIQKFDSDGTYLAQWGTNGFGDGEFGATLRIAIDSSGYIYVADYDNHRVQKFDSNGTYLDQWGTYGGGNGEFVNPTGIAIDGADNVYVSHADSESNYYRIQKFDTSGTYLDGWGGTGGSGNGELNFPNGLATDVDNNVYVADAGNHRVQKFDSDGTYLDQWGASGSGNGEFADGYGPGAVAVDVTGTVYVADTGNHRIQKFDTDGTYLTEWGSNGTGNGEFNEPGSLIVDPSGTIHVADTGNHRIQKFTYPPETAVLSSTSSGAAIQLESSAFTTFSCSTSVTEESLATTDTSNDYPLGLVDFCLDVVPGSTNTITVTFETDLLPDEVTARKYVPALQAYRDVPGAVITQTTLDGSPALQLKYDIIDGSELDDDGVVNGTILDPVGLAIAAETTTTDTSDGDTSTLADTGSKLINTYISAVALVGLALATFVIHKRRFV